MDSGIVCVGDYKLISLENFSIVRRITYTFEFLWKYLLYVGLHHTDFGLMLSYHIITVYSFNYKGSCLDISSVYLHRRCSISDFWVFKKIVPVT